MRQLSLSLLLILLLTGCPGSDQPTDPNGDDPPTGPVTYQTENAFPNLSFSQPLFLTNAGDGSNRLFVVEQGGTIRVFENDASTSSMSTFLDISGRLSSGGERGLLGLAFHPNYESNGYFYVNYTDGNGDTMISRFEVSVSNPDQADPSTEDPVLQYDQPYSNHNGGHIAFGPDGYLYIASGDGGSGGDPDNNGQDPSTLLGNILRIDVDGASNGNNYAIPPDNPFVDNNQGYREEVYAYGLRNPWRFSFDSDNGRLFAADVGQNQYEEIDLIESGGNYGWNIMEGAHCYNSDSCDQSGLILPIWEYDHGVGQSITGGYVYRGPSLSGLTGHYIYGDFSSGKIWALDVSDTEDPSNSELIDTDFSISSFGTDADNELYICSFNGNIYKLVEE
ncbi:MAG TPA: PQQ-dependent sugar dehydrogenase [Halalkalibaculum sp.]|nr:PQQ-dependent sugar dehydrogenase [Halalkalibaculum sp.]